MSGTRWSDIHAAIEAAGGPITPHPDPERARLLAESSPKPRVVVGPPGGCGEQPLDLDEEPPTSIPARPYTSELAALRAAFDEATAREPYRLTVNQPNPPSRRGWRRLFRRAA